jgi:hypothetical protein
MMERIAICAVGASILIYTAWSQTQEIKPSPPRPPKNTISQTISRTTYVQADKLEKETLRTTATAGPDGLTFVCHLYAAADQGGPATNQPGECPLPYQAKLDTSFRQQTFPTPCSGGGATTNLAVADIPQGIYLACDGGYYWAVLAPIRLEALQFDNNGTVTQWGVHIHQLYCGPGGAPNGGCNVKLDVYAKLKP